MPLAHAIEIDALTLDGADGPGLTANWRFAPALLDEAEVRDLAESWFRALTALVRHASRPGAGGRTPSDLALVDLTQAEIERLEGAGATARGHPAAVAAAGGSAVPCAVRCAGTGRLYGAAELELEGRLDSALLEARCRPWSAACEPAVGVPA